MRIKCIENQPFTTVDEHGRYKRDGKIRFNMPPVSWFTVGEEYEVEVADDRHFSAGAGSVVIYQDDNVSDLDDDDVWLTRQIMPGLYELQGFKGVNFQIVPEATECAS